MDGPPAFALEIFMLGPWQMKVAGEVVPNKAWKSKRPSPSFVIFSPTVIRKSTRMHFSSCSGPMKSLRTQVAHCIPPSTFSGACSNQSGKDQERALI